VNAEVRDMEVREVPITGIDQGVMTAVVKAEFDQAIVAAHAHPRSVKKFLNEALELATLSDGIADDCIYALPRKEGGSTKMIEGPSARLAEIVAHAWGNCRIGARVIEEGREFVTSEGVFHDLEKNVHIAFQVKRRITNKDGRRYSADMIGVTGNAASSIALRNAVFKGVPKAFWAQVYEACVQVIKGDIKTLHERRAKALGVLQKLGASQAMVLALLEVQGVDDITLDHLAQLHGIASSIKNEEMTLEEIFAPKPESKLATTKVDAAKDALRQQQRGDSSGKAPADQQGGGAKQLDAIPQYDEAMALAELQKAKSVKGLEQLYALIVKDFKDTNRELPQSVSAKHTEMKESLAEKEAKL